MISESETKARLRGMILLLLSTAILLSGSAAAPISQAAPIQPEPVRPALQEADAPLSVEGRLVPRQYVSLSTAASGQVIGLAVHEGDQVQAGTVLLRLGDQEQMDARLAAAEFELLSARQALDRLDDSAEVELALAKKTLAEAERDLAFAEDRVKSLKKTTPQERLDQAHANLMLAERKLERLNEDYDRWQKKFNNKEAFIRRFIDNRQFKFLFTGLEKEIAIAERRYYDALEKYNDLKKPVDPVDLAIAESKLAVAQADVAEAQRQVAILSNGPDPDLVAAAQARLAVAEAGQLAARTAMADSELVTPISGRVLDLNVKNGEWAEGGQPVIVVADDSAWLVETDDLTETEVPDVYIGQPVTVTPEALPELELSGVVESIKDLSQEKRGDVTYTVTVRLEESDPRLRWGMTVVVVFE
jgi:multidrug resistance efflux pump